MTSWRSSIAHQWDALLDSVSSPTRTRYREGWRAGYTLALRLTTDPDRLREWMRVAMNAAVVEEYGRGVDPLPPYGVDDSRDHARLTVIAGKLAAIMVQESGRPAVDIEADIARDTG